MKKVFLTSIIILALAFTLSASAQEPSLHPRGLFPTPGPTQATSIAPVIMSPQVETQPLPDQQPDSASTTLKSIVVSLADQNLKYFEGEQLIGEFKISSGLRGTPSPKGEFSVLDKKPLVTYKGANYFFPNTKWNLMFKKGSTLGNFYVHGAYWHHNFGHPMSHGCINVSYADMEPLYNWADVGTKVTIE